VFTDRPVSTQPPAAKTVTVTILRVGDGGVGVVDGDEDGDAEAAGCVAWLGDRTVVDVAAGEVTAELADTGAGCAAGETDDAGGTGAATCTGDAVDALLSLMPTMTAIAITPSAANASNHVRLGGG
jgi:hypothetical protein